MAAVIDRARATRMNARQLRGASAELRLSSRRHVHAARRGLSDATVLRRKAFTARPQTFTSAWSALGWQSPARTLDGVLVSLRD